MEKLLIFALIIALDIPQVTQASQLENEINSAFIRNGDLWLFEAGEQKRITRSGEVTSPSWAHDGEYILYQQKSKKHSEEYKIMVYELSTGKAIEVYDGGYAPKWSPVDNTIAFKINGILNVSDLENFYNVAAGVDSYTWLPDGSGFLISSSADLLPDGWTNPILYTKKLSNNLGDTELMDVNKFFTIPNTVEKGEDTILSIGTTGMSFSPSEKWISFTIYPTASWSMDENMLSVIRENGEDFQPLNIVALGQGKPQWAPTKDILAYIAGGGRIVFGFKNKDLTYEEMPASRTITPENFAELDFTWVTDNQLISSRVQEQEWSNDFSKHPSPALYHINIENQKQTKITNPPRGYGDYNPKYIPSADKLVWTRSKSLVGGDEELWIGNTDGTEASKWLNGVSEIVFYD